MNLPHLRRAPRRFPLLRFLACDHGTSATECALILGLIASLLLIAALIFGVTTQPAFQQLSFGILGQRTTPSSAQPGAAQPGGAAATANPTPAEDAQHPAFRPVVVSLLGAFIVTAIALAWVVGRRTRPATRPREDDAREVTGPARQAYIAKRQRIMRLLTSNPLKLMTGQLVVGDVMTSEIKTARPGTTLDELRAMMPRQMRHMPICARDGTLVGIVSDRDLKSASGRTAGEVMTRNPATVRSQSPLLASATQLLEQRISSLPVVDDGKLVGIVTSTDLMLATQCFLVLASNMETLMEEVARAHERASDARRERGAVGLCGAAARGDNGTASATDPPAAPNPARQ
jgi:CBS domain-containing protein/Flp pilus assembly pilin Flp